MASRVTIADVAREAGVSQQTVSRAINGKSEISDLTRQTVLDIVERLGYRPNVLARGLVTHRTSTIGLVVPDIANPFFSEIARGAEDEAHAAGYSLLFANTVEDPRRERDVLCALEEQRVEGIILCSSRLPDEDLLQITRHSGAVVLVNRLLPGAQMAHVSVDDALGGRLAVRHLVATGHRKIGYLAGPPGSESGRRRAEGFRSELADLGIGLDPELIVPCEPYIASGRENAAQLLRTRGDVTALFCYNDLVAVGALQACSAAGLSVPDAVAVVGCDDIMLSGLVTPPLTTIRAAKRDLGASAIRALLAQLTGVATGFMNVVQAPTLVIRASAPLIRVAEPVHAV